MNENQYQADADTIDPGDSDLEILSPKLLEP